MKIDEILESTLEIFTKMMKNQAITFAMAISMVFVIVITSESLVYGQRTQYDVDREETARNQRPSVS